MVLGRLMEGLLLLAVPSMVGSMDQWTVCQVQRELCQDGLLSGLGAVARAGECYGPFGVNPKVESHCQVEDRGHSRRRGQ